MIRTSGDDDAQRLAPQHVARWSQLDLPQRERLEELAYRWGDTYDSYLVTDCDRSYFWLGDHEGVVGYRRWGKQAYIVGGILAPLERRSQLLAEFTDFGRRNRWAINFFNVPRDGLDVYRKAGYEITKCGEEPVVCMEETDWKGGSYSWLRRQENFCQRQGVELEEAKELTPELRAELSEVSQAHLATTLHGHEMRFFVGQFDIDHLGRRRIFVAKDPGGRVLAFVMCNPGLSGAFWAVEAYRRRPDAPRGIVPFSILRTMRLLKQEGVSYVSLSLVPCLRSGMRDNCGNFYFRVLCEVWWKSMNWVFDVKGIYHFKSRFRPRYREMFLASFPRTTLASMFGIPAVWGLFGFNPMRLMRRGMIPARDRELAEPPPRPERLLRHLRIDGPTRISPSAYRP